MLKYMSPMNKKMISSTAIVVSIFFVIITGGMYFLYSSTNTQRTNQPTSLVTSTALPIISPTPLIQPEHIVSFTATQSGQTAFDLLLSQADVKYKQYDDLGVFIESINNIEGNNQYYWAMYVNDEYGQKGADQTLLNKDDTVTFIYEEVQNAF